MGFDNRYGVLDSADFDESWLEACPLPHPGDEVEDENQSTSATSDQPNLRTLTPPFMNYYPPHTASQQQPVWPNPFPGPSTPVEYQPPQEAYTHISRRPRTVGQLMSERKTRDKMGSALNDLELVTNRASTLVLEERPPARTKAGKVQQSVQVMRKLEREVIMLRQIDAVKEAPENGDSAPND